MKARLVQIRIYVSDLSGGKVFPVEHSPLESRLFTFATLGSSEAVGSEMDCATFDIDSNDPKFWESYQLGETYDVALVHTAPAPAEPVVTAPNDSSPPIKLEVESVTWQDGMKPDNATKVIVEDPGPIPLSTEKK